MDTWDGGEGRGRVVRGEEGGQGEGRGSRGRRVVGQDGYLDWVMRGVRGGVRVDTWGGGWEGCGQGEEGGGSKWVLGLGGHSPMGRGLRWGCQGEHLGGRRGV